jgi:alanyl-tRNA synthetase
VEVNGVKVISGVVPVDAQNAKDMVFQLRAQFTDNLLIALGSVSANKPTLTVAFSDDLVKAGKNAGQIVREAGKLIQGGGGGQPHFATAGGKNPDGLQDAVNKIIELAQL